MRVHQQLLPRRVAGQAIFPSLMLMFLLLPIQATWASDNSLTGDQNRQVFVQCECLLQSWEVTWEFCSGHVKMLLLGGQRHKKRKRSSTRHRGLVLPSTKSLRENRRMLWKWSEWNVLLWSRQHGCFLDVFSRSVHIYWQQTWRSKLCIEFVKGLPWS